MTEKDIVKRLNKAVDSAVPDVFDSVLPQCGPRKAVAMTNSRKNNLWKKSLAIAAVFALVLCIGIGLGVMRGNTAVDSVVFLDVNPSIELDINKKDKVIQARALNSDGEKILGEMKLEKTELDVALNAIIGSMLKNGYIDELANSILISVDGKDAKRAERIQQRVSNEISAILSTANAGGAVISQVLMHDEKAHSNAEKYGMSEGKAQFISEIVKVDERYTFDELAELSVHELNLIAVSDEMPSTVQSSGEASEGLYIGGEKAVQIALAHAGLDADSAKTRYYIEYERGTVIYEVDIVTDTMEYEYDINAKDGSVIEFEKDYRDDVPKLPSTVSGLITPEEAMGIAISQAGVLVDSVRDYECDLEEHDGVKEYEIEFKSGDREFKTAINAETGKLIYMRRDGVDKDFDDGIVSEPPAAGITAERAKEIVFEHAKVNEADVYDYECELDDEFGTKVYEIDFECNGNEYSYEIAVINGDILKRSVEKDD